MTKPRRLLCLIIGALLMALAVGLLLVAAWTNLIWVLALGCTVQALAVILLGLSLAPWGDEG